MKITKSTLNQIIREEATKLVELERLKRLQARDKMKKLEAQLAMVKKAQAEADRGMLDDPAGMGGAAYMDTDYRDSLKRQYAAITAEIEKLKKSGEAEIKKPTEKPAEKSGGYMTIGGVPFYGQREDLGGVYESKITKSTLRQIIREEATKLVEMERLKKLQARDAERADAASDVNKLYTLYALAPNHDLVKKAGGAKAILKKIRDNGYGVYSGLKNPHLNTHSREIFNQNIEDMYNLAHGEEPAFRGDEDMHTYASLDDKQKERLYYKVWDAYNAPGDRGDESIWADDFDYDS